jgi:hypothetical protein
MGLSPLLQLNDGNKMPQVGFGLWKVPNESCADIVYNAIKTGYRLFDGACGTFISSFAVPLYSRLPIALNGWYTRPEVLAVSSPLERETSLLDNKPIGVRTIHSRWLKSSGRRTLFGS